MFTNLAILNRAPRRLSANSSYKSWRSSPISQTDLTFCSSLKALTFWDTWQWQAFARHWDGSKSIKSWDTVHQKQKITQEKMQKNLCLPFHNGIQTSLLSTFNSPILQKKGESIGQLCSGWVWKSCGKKTKLGKKHLQYAWKSIPYSKPEKMPKSMSRVILMMSSSQFSGFLDLSAFLRGLVCLIFHPYIWIGIHKITYSYP